MIANKTFQMVLRRLPKGVRRWGRALRRATGQSAIQHVFRELRQRGVDPTHMQALEVFGRDGEAHTKDYAAQVAALDIWEIDPRYETQLRRNFPSATISIVDSIEELKVTTNKYDLIVVDNELGLFGQCCEHFDLFPQIMRTLNNRSVLILNVVPNIDDEFRATFPVTDEYLARRRTFYRTSRPEAVALEEMVATYRDIAESTGFELEWSFAQHRRSSYYNNMFYLVLGLQRRRDGAVLAS
jgi:hypothetical protein